MAEGAAVAVAAGTERSSHLANGILVLLMCRAFLSRDFCPYIHVVIGIYCNGSVALYLIFFLIRIMSYSVCIQY